jgi:hypothetical protein
LLSAAERTEAFSYLIAGQAQCHDNHDNSLYCHRANQKQPLVGEMPRPGDLLKEVNTDSRQNFYD